MQARAIYQAVRNDNIVAIKKFTPKNLLEFSDPDYNNIVLLAVRDAKLDTLKIILSIITNNFGQDKCDELLTSEDALHRTALALAAIANNVATFEYLHLRKNFDINYKNNGDSPLCYAMQRNSTGVFKYLLKNQATLTMVELEAISFSPEFKAYLNTPQNFLRIVQSDNMPLFNLIMRHIKGLSLDEQKKFLTHTDVDRRHALCLAAALNRKLMVADLSVMAFNIEGRDIFNKRCLYYFVLNRNYNLFLQFSSKLHALDPKEAALFSQHKKSILLNTKNSRNMISNALTNSAENFTFKGRIPKAHPNEKTRLYRSFSNARERQLLRQAATQLYFAFDVQLKLLKVAGLVEVQIMHLEFNGKHNLFIAANKPSVTAELSKIIGGKENFTTMLTKVYNPSDKEGQVRSARYAAKLQSRIVDGKKIANFKSLTDKKHADEVISLLNQGTPYALPVYLNNKYTLTDASKNLLKHVFLKTSNHIYIVTLPHSVSAKRHAEEFLADIADYATVVGSEIGITPYSCVGGKKRPCMGCTGRMTTSISQFGSYPGRFWVHTIENQTNTVAANTVNTLLTSSAHVSVCKDGVTQATDYDSGSDSEAEDKPYNKLRRT